MKQKPRKPHINNLESPATKEELLAKIDMIKIETQKKIDRIWRESLFDISGYEAELECFDQRGYMGYCHSYWQARKRILKEKYNIDWQTPAEENPLMIYD
jgi:hypothetical protein